MPVNVKADMRKVIIELGRVQDEVANKAAARALNRTAVTVRSEASREIRRSYNLKAGDLRRELQIRRASPQSLRAEVNASGRRLSLFRFDAKQNEQGVAVMIKKGRRVTIRSAFIARGTAGNPVVFARGVYSAGRFVPGRPRKPITALRTLSVPVMFSQEVVEKALERVARASFAKNYRHELMFAAGRVR